MADEKLPRGGDQIIRRASREVDCDGNSRVKCIRCCNCSSQAAVIGRRIITSCEICIINGSVNLKYRIRSGGSGGSGIVAACT